MTEDAATNAHANELITASEVERLALRVEKLEAGGAGTWVQAVVANAGALVDVLQRAGGWVTAVAVLAGFFYLERMDDSDNGKRAATALERSAVAREAQVKVLEAGNKVREADLAESRALGVALNRQAEAIANQSEIQKELIRILKEARP